MSDASLRIDHIQLAMPAGGEQQARQFYGRLLGMPEVPKPSGLRSRGGCWFRSTEYEVHIGVDLDFRGQRKAHPAFAVSDLKLLAERLAAADFDVAWDTAIPDVHRFFTADPFGNRIEFLAEGQGPRDRAAKVGRACGALLDGDRILMVRHRGPDADYWTLPGGHVEPDETPERAAVREMLEETGVEVQIVRALWDEPLPAHGGEGGVLCRCFLVKAVAGLDPRLGHDPEEAHIKQESRLLQEVGWLRTEELRDDSQVSRVFEALRFP